MMKDKCFNPVDRKVHCFLLTTSRKCCPTQKNKGRTCSICEQQSVNDDPTETYLISISSILQTCMKQITIVRVIGVIVGMILTGIPLAVIVTLYVQPSTYDSIDLFLSSNIVCSCVIKYQQLQLVQQRIMEQVWNHHSSYSNR
jgi:hypothetical protein